MSSVTLEKFWQGITIIEAQEQLKMMSVMDWPNMKKDKRQKAHKELHKQAYPSSMSPKNYITIDDLKNMVAK